MKPGDGEGPGSYGQTHRCELLVPSEILACGGPRRYAVPSDCGSKSKLQAEPHSTCVYCLSGTILHITWTIPDIFTGRSQGLLVRRLSGPGTKAQARMLNMGSKEKNEGCRNGVHNRAGSEEQTISNTFILGALTK